MKSNHWNSSAQVARLVKKCLEERGIVEVDGLGVFHRSRNGGYDFVANTRPRVFLAYVTEDRLKAEKLFDDLYARGLDPWMDQRKLLPGQNWPRSIERAIELSDSFVACFSKRSVRKRGQFQAELRYALDCAARLPLDEVFLIPVRFDDCRIPPEITRQFHYVDLFPEWRSAVERIAEVMLSNSRHLRWRPDRNRN